MRALQEDIAENGIREPIRYVERNGVKYVVDGHHRLRAAQNLGLREVPAQEVSLPYAGYRRADDLSYTR
jgi:ParB-like chromosome segregation protein Spo0J